MKSLEGSNNTKLVEILKQDYVTLGLKFPE